MTAPWLLSLGSINADFQARVDAAPGSAETLSAHDFVRLSGGKAANRAYLARRLGHPARLLGRVGNDELANQALDPLRRAGVDLAAVSTALDCATAVSMIAVGPDGKKAIVLAGNANDRWTEGAAAALADDLAAASPGSVLAADCEIPAAVVARAAQAACQRRLRLVIDPSFPDRADRAVLAMATALAPNADEAAALTGIPARDAAGAAAAADALAALGPPLVCVKLADGGCLAAHGGQRTIIPPLPVDVVDSTGAGDAFTGALAVALLEGQPPLQAAAFATAAAHHAVTGYGSQPSYPARPQIEALMPALLSRAYPL